jgi:anti-sigma B factor antagonist
MFEMKKDTRIAGTTLVAVMVKGELDINCAPGLQEDIRSVIESDCQHLLIDIDAVKHIDSFSLGTFLGIRQRMRAKGGSVSLVCHNPGTRRLFHITNLEKLFEFHESVEEFVRLRGGELTPTATGQAPL